MVDDRVEWILLGAYDESEGECLNLRDGGFDAAGLTRGCCEELHMLTVILDVGSLRAEVNRWVLNWVLDF